MVDMFEEYMIRYGEAKLYFRVNAVKHLIKFLKGCGLVALATSRRSARVSGALANATRIPNDMGVILFNKITSNPWASWTEELELLWREFVEAVIVIGGGSMIDVAKVVCGLM